MDRNIKHDAGTEKNRNHTTDHKTNAEYRDHKNEKYKKQRNQTERKDNMK